jgi:hypothetical protein
VDAGHNQDNNRVVERVVIRFVKLGCGVSHWKSPLCEGENLSGLPILSSRFVTMLSPDGRNFRIFSSYEKNL